MLKVISQISFIFVVKIFWVDNFTIDTTIKMILCSKQYHNFRSEAICLWDYFTYSSLTGDGSTSLFPLQDCSQSHFIGIQIKMYKIFINKTFRFLPESLHWLITNKKTKQVTRLSLYYVWVQKIWQKFRYIRKTTKVNKMEIALHECQSTTPENGSDNGSAIGRTYVDMFRSPPLVFHLVLHSFIM